MGSAATHARGRPPRPGHDRLRIGFPPLGGAGWLGGLHYLTTLLSALSEHAGDDVETVLFLPPGVDDEVVAALRPHVSEDPVLLPAIPSRPGAALRTAADLLQRRSTAVEAACRQARIDVVFQHTGWLGSRFPIPTVAWLGDLQHRLLPEMFSRRLRWRRELRFQAVLRSASLLYVLSETDRELGHTFYPAFAPKLRALPFAVPVPDEAFAADPAEVVARYGLPPKFFLFPGQHWRHKNHLGVIEAVAQLKRAGQDVVVVTCGNPVDNRDPRYGPLVAQRRAELGVEEQVRMLGVVPRRDVWALLRASAAVLNPSLYEGWSTPVEEAKSIGAPLLLSDLPVHREQQPASATYFDPRHPASIADALQTVWHSTDPGPRREAERSAAEALVARRRAFAHAFVRLAAEVSGQSQRSPSSPDAGRQQQ